MSSQIAWPGQLLRAAGILFFAAISATAWAQTPPAGPFYIQSRIGNSDWVLTAAPDNTNVRLTHKTGAFNQLWTARVDSRGGFFLVNVANDRVLKHTRLQGGTVQLATSNLGDPAMLWKIDKFGGDGLNNIGLTTLGDWEQKLNVAGNGPYNESSKIIVWEYSRAAHNETWSLIADPGTFTVQDIQYDLGAARINLNMPPRSSVAVRAPNSLSTPIRTTLKLSRTEASSRGFSYSQTDSKMLSITNTFRAQLTVKKIVEVENSTAVTVETKTENTFGRTEETSETNEVAMEVEVEIPGNKTYEYQVQSFHGEVVVPYKARLARTLPTGQVEYTNITGTYRNVSGTRYDIVARDITVPSKPVAITQPEARVIKEAAPRRTGN